MEIGETLVEQARGGGVEFVPLVDFSSNYINKRHISIFNP